MRHKINLDVATLDRAMVLVHGPYGAGKTHLGGDMLRWCKEQNLTYAFVNLMGEDGATSLAAMGLGDHGETVDTVGDLDEAIAEYAKAGTYGVVFDSLPALYWLINKNLFGEIRYPDPKLDGDRAKMLWGQLTMQTLGRLRKSRLAGQVVLWLAADDKSEDVVQGGQRTTPNLVGRLAREAAGCFDFEGHLTANTISDSKVKREITFAPSGAVQTRQRSATTIIAPISIPKDRGGWNAVWAAMQASVRKPEA
jgi:hypothetical protein